MEQGRTFAVFLGQNTDRLASGFVVENGFCAVLEIEATQPDSRLRTITDTLQETLKSEFISSAVELKQFAHSFFQEYKLSSLAIGCFYKKQLFTFSKNAAVLLLRQKQLYLASQEDRALSGSFDHYDHFLFATNTVAPLLTKKPIKPFTHQEPKTIIDEFKTQLSPDKGALLVIQTIIEPTLPNKPEPILTLPKTQSSSLINRIQTMIQLKWVKPVGIGLVLLIILWQGFVFINQVVNKQRNKAFSQQLSSLSQDYVQLEKKLQKNPTSAAVQINDFNKQLDQLISRYPTKTEEYDQLKQKLKTLTTAYGNAQLTKEEVFFDLSLIDEKATANYLDLTQEFVTLLDSKNKQVYLINIVNKNVQELSFKKELQPTLATEYNKQAYLFDQKSGIYKEASGEFSNIAKANKSWGKIIDLDVFNGNVYLLSQDKDEIFKFTPTENGYSSALSYFQSGQSLNLQNAKNISIDFSVYLLSNQVYKFTAGSKDGFNNPPQLDYQNMTQIYKNAKTNFIYLLDKTGSRIVALNEEGKIIKSIFNPLLSECNQFGVYQDELIIFLRQNKLYKLDNF